MALTKASLLHCCATNKFRQVGSAVAYRQTLIAQQAEENNAFFSQMFPMGASIFHIHTRYDQGEFKKHHIQVKGCCPWANQFAFPSVLLQSLTKSKIEILRTVPIFFVVFLSPTEKNMQKLQNAYNFFFNS